MRVQGLFVYPVKACRALALEDAAVGPLGLEHDRRFAFVADDGLALTQRDQPLLATVVPSLHRHELRLDFGGLIQLAIPLHSFSRGMDVDVWGKQVPARSAPETLVADAADYLGTSVRLVPDAGNNTRLLTDSVSWITQRATRRANFQTLIPCRPGA